MKNETIGSVSTALGSGLTPLRSNKRFWNSADIPWLKTEQIGSFEIFDTNEYISIAALNESSIKIWKPRTLSIAMYGEGKTRGKVSIIMREMTTNQACCNIEINEKIADYRYVYYWLLNNYERLRAISSGVRNNLNADIIRDFEIILPDLPKQEDISQLLYNIDKQIANNNAINAELERLAKTIYEYWFVQFDFPNEQGKPYKSSGGAMEYNPTLKREVPKGWEAIPFSKIINENKETLGAGFDRGAEHSIDLSVMPSGTMCLNGRGKASDFDSNKFVLRKFDLLFGSIRPYLKKSGFSAFDGALNSSVLNFRPIKKDNYSFALCTLTSELMLQYAVMISSGQGTRMPTIGAEEILDFSIAYNSDLAKVFNNKVSTYWHQIASNINQNFELANLRDFLLPLLMNGQVTVRSLE